MTARHLVLAAAVWLGALPSPAEQPPSSATIAAPGDPAAVEGAKARDARRGRAWWSQLPDRGWLGVKLATFADLERALAAERLPDEWVPVPNLEWLATEWDGTGALIHEVMPNSPAEKAGLLPGDVVLSMNGIRTTSPGVLVFVVQRAVAGHDGDFEVLRDGEKRRVLVEFGMHPEDARRLEQEAEDRAKHAAREERR